MNDGVMCPKQRPHCHGADDYKFKCPHCGKRAFVSKGSIESYERHWNEKVTGIWLECRQCQQDTTYDVSEKKDWYGEYDGKVIIEDLLYCGEYKDGLDIPKLISDIKGIYPDAQFKEHYSSVDGRQITLTIRGNWKEYFKNIIQLGYAGSSFNINFVAEGIKTGICLNPDMEKELLAALKEIKNGKV